MAELFSGSFLKTSPERHWMSCVMASCPAGPPLLLVKGQETAASGQEEAPGGGGQGPRLDKGGK